MQCFSSEGVVSCEATVGLGLVLGIAGALCAVIIRPIFTEAVSSRT